ncbi:HdeD family acid-resistance protein [Pedococcus sp. NPDC057267]|uniref:HdeD family acid-resistance protein n=1 Tax=Pedococcus sp. NPDC057267 TaxID=3346077 RepID=UPI00363BE3DF
MSEFSLSSLSGSSGAAPGLTPELRRRLGWVGVVVGVGSVALGIAAIAWPGATLVVVAVLFGAQLLVTGIRRILLGVAAPGLDTWVRALLVVLGVMVTIAGLICIRNPFTSLAVIVVLVSVSWLLDGAGDLVSAFSSGREAGQRALLAVGGVLSVVGALVILFWPELALLTLTRVGGWILVILGVAQVVTAARAVRTPKVVPPAGAATPPAAPA